MGHLSNCYALHYQLVTVLFLSNPQFLVAFIHGAPVSDSPARNEDRARSASHPAPSWPGRRGQAWLAAVHGLVTAGWQKATFNNIHTLQLCDETLPVNTVYVLVFQQKNTWILCVVFLVA